MLFFGAVLICLYRVIAGKRLKERYREQLRRQVAVIDKPNPKDGKAAQRNKELDIQLTNTFNLEPSYLTED